MRRDMNRMTLSKDGVKRRYTEEDGGCMNSECDHVEKYQRCQLTMSADVMRAMTMQQMNAVDGG